ncbi:MAG: hypothetical protein Q8922_14020 [Bacteroidota bacterium]|nr:hypothetical protein [Bacteroidota bacterium]MDP4233815.1 hypothetical protein [Bacteroidota bacterium]MDP4242486.1 hypothetical protein [Bacteroidota bacterium]MDP4289036.1 hypothetical protein [Bacteroidota bacterium]
MKKLLIVLSCAIGAAFLIDGCHSSTSCPDMPSVGAYTISGHLKYRNPLTLPADAQLLCCWMEPGKTVDTEFIYGKGSIDPIQGTFSITLQGTPPRIQTVQQDCKIATVGPSGYIVVMGQGGQFYGTIDSTAVLYCVRNCALHSWMGKFPQGYGIGLLDTAYGLTQASNTGLELVIDTSVAAFHLPHDWLGGPMVTKAD